SLAQRIAYLERNTPNAAFGALANVFGNLPFGRENAWLATAQVSQPLFAGGRIVSTVSLANRAADAAEAGLEEARAAVAFEVKQAYLQAALAEQQVLIMEASLALAEEHLAHVRLLLETGQTSELEVLRA